MGPDVTAQLMHDVSELWRVGQLQVARSRQVDVAPHHDAPRAPAHDVHRVGQEDTFAQVVRDEDDVEALRRLQVAQRAPKLLPRESVERTEGLIQQKQLRFVHQRAANAGTLLHAARELPRKLVFVSAQAHALKQLARLGFVFGAFAAKVAAKGLDDFQRQQHVTHRRAPRQQARRLEGHAADLERARHRQSADVDAAFAGQIQARGELHERALAAAAGPDDGDEFTFVHLQRDVFHRVHALGQQFVVVGKPDVLEVDKGGHGDVARLGTAGLDLVDCRSCVNACW